jgi:5-methylcytosine-specific restriction enzyme subunit McrC
VLIPIQNLYFLLLYAWDQLEHLDAVDLSATPSEQPVDLFATVLAQCLERVLKRGPHRAFEESHQETDVVRGRIDFAGSADARLVSRRRVVCVADELTHDSQPNRIVKTTLRRLAAIDGLDRDLRSRILGLYRRLQTVRETPINERTFTGVQLDRNSRAYVMLLSICEIVWRGMLAEDAAGRYRFVSFHRDEVLMRRVFEKFVRNFLAFRLRESATVSARRIVWADARGTSEALKFLPTLNIDSVVEFENRTLLIETKYTPKPLDNRFSSSRFRSSHLYQLYAYLRNYPRPPTGSLHGLLLYPSVGAHIDLEFSLGGTGVRVATLDLSMPWRAVEDSLLGLVLPSGSRAKWAESAAVRTEARYG